MPMKKPLVAILFGALLGGGTALAEGGGLKNLQVLPKTSTKEEVKKIMRAQSRALGVECEECHEVPDMASDKIPLKDVARQMMRMTDEINGRWLKGMKDAEKNRVTCATCHRGKKVPSLD